MMPIRVPIISAAILQQLPLLRAEIPVTEWMTTTVQMLQRLHHLRQAAVIRLQEVMPTVMTETPVL